MGCQRRAELTPSCKKRHKRLHVCNMRERRQHVYKRWRNKNLRQKGRHFLFEYHDSGFECHLWKAWRSLNKMSVILQMTISNSFLNHNFFNKDQNFVDVCLKNHCFWWWLGAKRATAKPQPDTTMEKTWHNKTWSVRITLTCVYAIKLHI